MLIRTLDSFSHFKNYSEYGIYNLVFSHKNLIIFALLTKRVNHSLRGSDSNHNWVDKRVFAQFLNEINYMHSCYSVFLTCICKLEI